MSKDQGKVFVIGHQREVAFLGVPEDQRSQWLNAHQELLCRAGIHPVFADSEKDLSVGSQAPILSSEELRTAEFDQATQDFLESFQESGPPNRAQRRASSRKQGRVSSKVRPRKKQKNRKRRQNG